MVGHSLGANRPETAERGEHRTNISPHEFLIEAARGHGFFSKIHIQFD